MSWLWLFFNLAFAHSLNSELTTQFALLTNTPADEKLEKASPSVEIETTSAHFRQQAKTWMTLNFSPIDFLVPRKLGLSLGYSFEPQAIYELEYLKSRYSPFVSSELGTFNDQRISILYRSFGTRNSFNYQFGLSHLTTNLEIGNYLYQKIAGGLYPYSKAFEIQSVGMQFGIGNEWIFFPKYLTPVRIDWFSITQPLFALKQESPILDYLGDSGARSAINSALSIAKWSPRFALFKIEAGFAF